MYKIYFNDKSKQVLKDNKLNEVKITSEIHRFFKEEELEENQDIICTLELSSGKLYLMGHKKGKAINIIHATTKIIRAKK